MKSRRTIKTAALIVLLVSAAAAARGGEGMLLAQASKRNPGNSGLADRPFTDQKSGFSITPPGGWYLDSKTRRFAVRFSSTDYHAFLMVDIVEAKDEIKIGTDFIKFINAKNKEVRERVNTFTVENSTTTRIGGRSAFLTEASFTAGKNLVMMDIYYIPAGNKVYMITTAYPEAEKQLYDRVLSASARTFLVL